jgi:ATP-dependent helicase/nuclease subunit B
MNPFLYSVAKHIFENHSENLEELTIVLPSKRGAVFLKKYLHEVFQKTIWLPTIWSIDEFVTELSQLEVIDNLHTLLEFYPFYREFISQNWKEQDGLSLDLSLESYLRKANTLIQDFNEVDRHLVDPKEIFTNLKDIKYIENWSLNQEALSPFQENYLALYNAMGEMYQVFTKHLLDQKKAYQGLAYRHAVKRFKNNEWQVNSHFLFCGFNAFNTAESTIITQLVKQKKATVLWDADSYYLNDPQQEAGFFLREVKSNHTFGGGFNFEFNNLKTDHKSIHIIGTPNNISQTHVLQNTLQEWQQLSYRTDQTAVIMADESLLIPVIYAIPDSIEKLNVTLGYEIKNSALYGLLMQIIQLHDYAHSHQKIYYKDILQILNHALIQRVYSNNREQTINIIKDHLLRYNIVFTSFNKLQILIPESHLLLKTIFTPIETAAQWISINQYVILELKNKLYQNSINERLNIIEEQVLFEMHKIFNQLTSIVPKIPYQLSLKDCKALFQQVVSSTAIDFKGEPLSGLQIMGILESRTLDFENVILLSVNEGVLPSGKSNYSFIPFDLKLHFGLPVHYNKDAIYAYHFWHILQRAKNITIVYNSEGDDLQKGEKSRFITQLETELTKYNPSIQLKTSVFSPLNNKKTEQLDLAVNNTELIIQTLSQKFLSDVDQTDKFGFSASSINMLIQCPLKFYYQYALKLNETLELEETIQADTFGNIIHYILEVLYQPYVMKVLSMSSIESIEKEVDSCTDEAFLKFFKEQDYKKGKNYLAYISIKKYIHQFLQFDKKRIKDNQEENRFITLLGLEVKINKTLTIPVNDKNEVILFSGKLDRIEQIGDNIQIIDFKSNFSDQASIKFSQIGELFSNEKRKDKALQLFYYEWLMKDQNIAIDKTIKASIISLRAVNRGFHTISAINQTNEDWKIFESHLSQMVQRLLNKDFIFTPTDQIKTCEWCSFNSICHRD